MPKRRHEPPRTKWKNLGFLPEGWDESKTIKYRDEGFLFLCRLLRDDWKQFSKCSYRARDLKPDPRQAGRNCGFDWTGLKETLSKVGTDLSPPPTIGTLTYRKPGPEEREHLGRSAHLNWLAIRTQQRAGGMAVPDEELMPWEDLPDTTKELFRRSGESLALPEEAFWNTLEELRQKMGEKAFRKKLFELSLSVLLQKALRAWSEAERYQLEDIIVKLTEMLDVPTPKASQ